MKRSEAFPSKYLNKDQLITPLVGVIESVVIETLGQGDEQDTKPIMYFSSGVPKPAVVNATNWINVESVYGDDSDAWIGQRIELWFDPNVSYGGKRTGGIRMRAPSAATAPGLPEAWTIERAKVELEKNGLTVDTLKAALKANGRVNAEGAPVYAAAVDTALVRQIISDALAAPEAAL